MALFSLYWQRTRNASIFSSFSEHLSPRLVPLFSSLFTIAGVARFDARDSSDLSLRCGIFFLTVIFGEPIPTNKRHDAAKIFSHPAVIAEEPRCGIEQVQTLLPKDVKRPIGWPLGGYPRPQWEFQVGPAILISTDDKLWLLTTVWRCNKLDMNYSSEEELYCVFVPTNHLYIGDVFLINSKDVIRPNQSVREGIDSVNPRLNYHTSG